jgi:predicted patatin/cPLA2 family phospholipase
MGNEVRVDMLTTTESETATGQAKRDEDERWFSEHWIRRLPEVGDPMLRRVREMSEIRDRIAELKRQEKALKAELRRQEHSAEMAALDLWTAAEVKAAKEGGR